MKLKSLALVAICLPLIGCNKNIELKNLPSDIQQKIKEQIQTELSGQNFSINLENGKCLGVKRHTPGFFTAQPEAVDCEQTEIPSLGDIKFTYIDSLEDVPIFHINAGTFTEKFYMLNSVSINKNCEIESAAFINAAPTDSDPTIIPFPTTDLSLANNKLFEGKSIKKYSHISALMLDKRWSIKHTTEESNELTNILFETLTKVLKDSAQDLANLPSNELKTLGLSQKILEKCK